MRITMISALLLLTAGVALGAPVASGRASEGQFGFGDRSSQSYLLNQMDGGASGSGNASQDFETAFDPYDIWFADDFDVPIGIIWDITGASVESFDGDGFDEAYFHGVNYYIFVDRGDGMPDFYNPLFQYTMGGGYYEFAQIDAYFDVTLLPGHYWFCAQGELDFEAWGQIFIYSNQNFGSDGVQINPGNGFGMGTNWFSPGYDMNFALSGTERPVPEPGTAAAFAGLGLGLLGLALRRK